MGPIPVLVRQAEHLTTSRVPEHHFGTTSGRDETTTGTDGGANQTRANGQWRSRGRTTVNVPHTSRTVARAGDHLLAIWRKRGVVHTGKMDQRPCRLFAGRDLPDLRGTIATGGDDVLSVGTEVSSFDISRVLQRWSDRLAGPRVPDPAIPVIPARENLLSGGIEGGPPYRLTGAEFPRKFSSLYVPNPRSAGTCRQHPFVVDTEFRVPYTAIVLQSMAILMLKQYVAASLRGQSYVRIPLIRTCGLPRPVRCRKDSGRSGRRRHRALWKT